MTKKLAYLPYGQAHVYVDTDGDITLYSYSTPILFVSPSSGWISCVGPVTYSRTTINHVSKFMKEYCAPLDYHSIKQAYKEHFDINYLTGEIKERN